MSARSELASQGEEHTPLELERLLRDFRPMAKCHRLSWSRVGFKERMQGASAVQ